MRLGIDARMIKASGIGRYTRHILYELRNQKFEDCILLGNSDDLALFASPHWDIVEFREGIYSPKQHFNYPLGNHSVDVMYYPHIHLPFFTKVGRKTVVTIHDTFHISEVSDLSIMEKQYMRMYYHRALTVADSVIPNSVFTLSEIKKHFPRVANTKYEVIYPYLGEFNPSNYPLSAVTKNLLNIVGLKKSLLFVGNLKPHKNIYRLCGAMAQEDLKDCILFIVGKRDGFLKGISSRDQALLEADNIVFTGEVSDSVLKELYRTVDLLVFPSLYEGFGSPPIECLASGTPVVASSLPVIHEVCGEAAHYFDPLSVSSMTEAIVASLAMGKCVDHEKIKDLVDRYSVERTVRRIVLEKLLA